MQAYLAQKRATIHALSGQGLHCGYLAGVHPRNITDDMNPDDAVRLVKPCLDDPLCLGIGEIGLEYDSLHEKEILAAQLSLVPELIARGKKIGLHTPRKNKMEVTLALLALLEATPDVKPLAVIDHCSAGTLPAILEAGYHAGITLSPIKTEWRSLPALTEKHADSINRILCNTDSGTEFYEDLLTASKAGQLESGTANMLFRDNAARFFQLAA
jgi:predicted metal-dependent TIM-barrel fold hydrolase